jgi:hypothetical protein
MANNKDDYKYPDEIVDKIKNVRQEKAVDKMSDMAKNSSKGLLLGAIAGYIYHRKTYKPLYLSVLGGMLLGGSIGYFFTKRHY